MCVFFLGTLGECSGYVCSVAWGKGCAGGVGMVWVACGVVRVPSRGRVLCVCVCCDCCCDCCCGDGVGSI